MTQEHQTLHSRCSIQIFSVLSLVQYFREYRPTTSEAAPLIPIRILTIPSSQGNSQMTSCSH
jgi:hypothetical protein